MRHNAFYYILFPKVYQCNIIRFMKSAHFREAARTTIPVFFGYIAIGIPLGLMVVNAGYAWWLAPVMSILMFAGAGEYMAIGFFANGVTLANIALAELLINVRHIFYGLSLFTKFKNVGRWKPVLIFCLTDETYSLLTMTDAPENANKGSYFAAIALLDYSYWVLGTIIGAIAGTLIPFSFEGVDFALTALFAVLLISQIEKSHDALPPVIGAATVTAAIVLSKIGVLPSEHILLVSLVLGVAALMLLRGKAISQNGGGSGAGAGASETSGGANGMEDLK